MELKLNGRRALVTGATGGIGRAIAAALAAEGCDLTLLARDPARLSAEAGALAAATGRRVGWHAADLTAPGAAEAALRAHRDAIGGLDILVNCAGASAAGDIRSLTDAEWAAGFAVKFHGSVRMCRACLDALAASGHGVIINIIGAAWKQPRAQFLLGASVNGALAAFTKGLAATGAECGVRVVAISPGPVRTPATDARLRAMAAEAGRDVEELAAARARDMFGMTGYVMPEEIAALACHLASDLARHLHGANIIIDGGQTREL
ncbi:MAG: SDR family oxidoreductase [Alphaproteobacteria bacterium]|nr:MAG: SDR family oxidoreductase [Alphaproteobacteria bacterium]